MPMTPTTPSTHTGRAARRADRFRQRAPVAPGGEPAIVRQTRDTFITWASITSGVVVLHLATGGWNPALFAMAVWGGFGVLPRFFRLWNAGYSWRDVFQRPAASDAMEAQLAAAGARPLELGPATTGEFGPQTAAIEQARSDRKAILRIMERLPKSEKNLLPDVIATVDGLLKRAEELARTLHAMSGDVDAAALARLDAKIDATKRSGDGGERERQLSLLQRQRQALADLVTRRQLIGDQIQSCVIAMQNVRFDLLRLRSAGVAAVLDDLTHATQQARVLSREVDHAIAAAGEIKAVLGNQLGA